MKHIKQEWFFILDKLQIRPAERFFVGTMSLMLILFWIISPVISGPDIFDDEYYKPVIEEFKAQAARNYIEREEVLQNYYPGDEDAIARYVVQAIPEATPIPYRKQILNKVKELKQAIANESRPPGEGGSDQISQTDTIPKVTEPDATPKINLNSAGVTELMKLPRVGEVTARRIIAWREENGVFKRIEDVMEVSGIGPKTFEQFAHMVEV
jgi:competence ComEA-like helix-hairpin-helix protein